MKKVLSTIVAALVAMSFSAVVFAADVAKPVVVDPAAPAADVKKEEKKTVKKTKKGKKVKKEIKEETTVAPTATPAAK